MLYSHISDNSGSCLQHITQQGYQHKPCEVAKSAVWLPQHWLVNSYCMMCLECTRGFVNSTSFISLLWNYVSKTMGQALTLITFYCQMCPGSPPLPRATCNLPPSKSTEGAAVVCSSVVQYFNSSNHISCDLYSNKDFAYQYRLFPPSNVVSTLNVSDQILSRLTSQQII